MPETAEQVLERFGVTSRPSSNDVLRRFGLLDREQEKEERVAIEAIRDPLFLQAPTDTARLRRANQIRRAIGTEESDAMPPVGDLSFDRQQYIDTMEKAGVSDRVLNAVSNFAREYPIAFTGKTGKGLMGLLDQAVDPKLKGDRDLEDLFLWQMFNRIEQYGEERLPTDPRLEGEFLSTALPAGAGSMAGFMVPATVAAKAGRFVPTIATAITGSALEGQSQREGAKFSGVDKELRDLAERLGNILGVGEIAGEPLATLRLLRRMDTALGRRIIPSILAGGGIEAAQEGLQQLGSNAIAQAYGSNRRIFDGVAESAAVGGILGGTLRGIANTVRNASLKRSQDIVQAVEAKGYPTAAVLKEVGVPVKNRAEAKSEYQKAKKEVENNAKQESQVSQGPTTQGDGQPQVGEAQASQAQASPVLMPWLREAMIREGKNPDRLFNDVDVVQGLASSLANDPIVKFLERTNPQLAERAKRGDLSAAELREAMQAARAEGPVNAVLGSPAGALPLSEQLQQQTQIPRGAARAVALPPALGATRQADYWPSDEVKRRVQAARGMKRETLRSKIRRWSTEAFHMATRPDRHVSEKQFPVEADFFRQHRSTNEVVTDETNRTIGAILGGLGGKESLDLFADALVVRNQLAALERGEPLRFGFENEASVRETSDRIDAMIAANPAVADALQQRSAIVNELVSRAVELNLLPESALENTESYFHQQVLMYQQAQNVGAPSAGTPRPKRRSFQRRRVKGESLDEKYDYNTSYIESEVRWMIDARTEIRKAELLQRHIAPSDIKAKLLEEAKALQEQGRDVKWADLVPEGYEIWQPRPGRALYQAYSIPDKIAEQLIAGELEGLDPDVLRTVLAIGQPLQQMVLPDPVVKQLLETEKDAKKDLLVDRAVVKSLNLWKQYTLMNPKRLAAYNFRNMSGDIDPVIGGALGAFKHVPSAAMQLKDFYSKKVAVSPDIKVARDWGVIGSTMTEQEIPDLKQLPIFQRFYDRKLNIASIPANALRLWFRGARNFSTFRENIMRYATFLDYRQQLRDGTLRHYGASRKSSIKAIQERLGNDAAAGKLARDLLGDYANVTELGKWLRSHLFPFWSFQEINLKRAVRMMINAATIGDVKSMVGVPLLLLYRTVTLTRLATFFAGTWAWNNLLFPDDEDELSPWQQQNPHLNLGRNPDGTIRTFNNFGAVGELLEWFGVNTMLGLWELYEDEQMTAAELVTEMLKDPMNKLVQSARPDVKGVGEIATGVSLFPDVMSPRVAKRDELFAQIFGLVDELRAAKGKLMEMGDRARPHYLQRALVTVTDPRQNALNEIYSLREQFLKSEGKDRPGFFGPSAIQNMKLAAINNDHEAFDEAKRAYIEGGGNVQKFIASLRRIDPIAARLNDADEFRFEQEFLTPRQRGKLSVARDYANELVATLGTWWEDSQ